MSRTLALHPFEFIQVLFNLEQILSVLDRAIDEESLHVSLQAVIALQDEDFICQSM
jgi:hypothetical protein